MSILGGNKPDSSFEIIPLTAERFAQQAKDVRAMADVSDVASNVSKDPMGKLHQIPELLATLSKQSSHINGLQAFMDLKRWIDDGDIVVHVKYRDNCPWTQDKKITKDVLYEINQKDIDSLV